MHRGDIMRSEPGRHWRGRAYQGLAARVMPYRNIVPSDIDTYAGAKSLGKRFLDGKPLGQEARRLRGLRVFSDFVFVQNPVQETIAEAKQRIFDPLDTDNISADAKNHAYPDSGDGALPEAVRYCRTVSAM